MVPWPGSPVKTGITGRLQPVSRPVIAAVATLLPQSETPKRPAAHVAISERYVQALQRAGARVVLFPAVAGSPEVPPAELLATAHGLCLIGGGDLDPATYGQAPHDRSYGFNPDRDRVELTLARHAVAEGLPLLAICRGCQVVNVALGGTLHQHLADLPGIKGDDHGRPHDLRMSEHAVVAEPDSALAAATGARVLDRCTSAHHQAVHRLGEGLRVTGRAPDGCIEAIELVDGRAFALAVQWHPEITAADDPQQQALFDALVAAAAERRDRTAAFAQAV
jgi:putative glutamine amidotransferase